MKRLIDVRIAGQERIERVEVEEGTTTRNVLETVGLPPDRYELSVPGQSGIFGKDEVIFDKVKDGAKVIAAPVTDVGC